MKHFFQALSFVAAVVSTLPTSTHASDKEFCASSFKDIEASTSTPLKKAVPVIRGKRFTNVSNTTHVRFAGADRLELATYSTTASDGGDLEFSEGTFRICESEGEIKIESMLSRSPVPVIFDEKGCFRLGGIAALGGDRVKFCPGEIPAHVQAALDRETKRRDVATTPGSPARLNESAGVAR